MLIYGNNEKGVDAGSPLLLILLLNFVHKPKDSRTVP